jgi:23S rRNA pseudouridine1911/1915/1917 synthase
LNRGFEYAEEIGAAAAGRTVLGWLTHRYRHSPEAMWRERIASGEVLVDDSTALAMDLLRPGQRLVWRRPPWEEPAVPLGFAILFRDDALLALAKPRGMPTVPAGGFLEHTLLHRVRRLRPEAVPLHRLGRGTSGLVLFALTETARRALAAEWRAGRVEKEYRALVRGRPRATAFTVDTPIGPMPHPRLGQVHAASPHGRPAVSHVRVLSVRDDQALVSVSIQTGRPHQIRVHLAAAGHPLVGDPLYVEGGIPGRDPALPGEGGYRLHAYRLVLRHPSTGRRLELECPPPPDLRERLTSPRQT